MSEPRAQPRALVEASYTSPRAMTGSSTDAAPPGTSWIVRERGDDRTHRHMRATSLCLLTAESGLMWRGWVCKPGSLSAQMRRGARQCSCREDMREGGERTVGGSSPSMNAKLDFECGSNSRERANIVQSTLAREHLQTHRLIVRSQSPLPAQSSTELHALRESYTLSETGMQRATPTQRLMLRRGLAARRRPGRGQCRHHSQRAAVAQVCDPPYRPGTVPCTRVDTTTSHSQWEVFEGERTEATVPRSQWVVLSAQFGSRNSALSAWSTESRRLRLRPVPAAASHVWSFILVETPRPQQHSHAC
jgi:hypothetical protein